MRRGDALFRALFLVQFSFLAFTCMRMRKKILPIPHIIHQMHVTHDRLSTVERQLSDGCQRLNKDFAYRFWTDAAIDAFVKNHFPNDYAWWKVMEPPIKRADTSRYMLLYTFGGVYIDLDVECISPLSKAIASLPKGTAWVGGFPEPFQLMSSPRNAFWLHMIRHVEDTVQNKDAWTSSGPAGLNDAIVDYVRGRDVIVPWKTSVHHEEWTKNAPVPWFYNKSIVTKRRHGDNVGIGFWPNQLVDPGACAESKHCPNESCASVWPWALYAHHCIGSWRVMS